MNTQRKTNGAKTSNYATDAYAQPSILEKVYKETVPSEGKEATVLSDFMNRTLLPLLLIFACPNVVIVLWYCCARCNGSLLVLYQRHFMEKSTLTGLQEIWSHVHILSSFSVLILLGYFTWAVLLMKLLPGKIVKGPVTPKGHVPVYVDNGFSCYVVTMVALVLLQWGLSLYGLSTSIIYDRFDEFLGTVNVLSLVFCLFLYFKGRFYPSSPDNGTSGNFIFDYYWGTELYPRVYGVDIKVFTNCRFGMTVWPIMNFICAVKSYELHGLVDSVLVSTILQLLYVTKFFWWEAGYMGTIDIMLDRAGYYICWGCLVYIPGFYCSVSYYMATKNVRLGPILSCAMLGCGMLSLWLNYWADMQKQEVRATKGNCTIWGRKPKIIHAKYQLENGEGRESILLASGWWGVSRHFHYLPELCLAFCWSVPSLFYSFVPYMYFSFLLVLLTHRSFRDDAKCSKKYGEYWKEYCKRVPYKIIPYVF